MTILNVYFIHASHLKDRERVINDFKNLIGKYMFHDTLQIRISIIDKYEPGSINMEIIQKTVNYEPIKEKNLEFYNQAIKNLHIFQLSNILKHYEALRLISLNDADTISLVLEDDILYQENVLLNLDRILHKKEYGDLLFLGLPGTNSENSKQIFQHTKDLYRILPYIRSATTSLT